MAQGKTQAGEVGRRFALAIGVIVLTGFGMCLFAAASFDNVGYSERIEQKYNYPFGKQTPYPP